MKVYLYLKEPEMEISNIDAGTQTAALAQAMSAQQLQSQIIMETLQKMQEMELQMLQSLGKAMNINIEA